MRRKTRRIIAFYIFILPWLVGFLLLMVYSVAFLFVGSFTRYSLIAPMEFIGLDNYLHLIKDPLFWQSLKVTMIFIGIGVPGSIVFALFLAILLNVRLPMRGIFRSLFFLPAILLGSVAVSVLWTWMYDKDYGIINYLLSFIGIQGPAWLKSETWALPSMIIMYLWGCGQAMVIFLAGLQGIPNQFYEAASIDGAGWKQKFWYITIPMLSPFILFNLITGIIQAVMVFTPAYVMTQGGPNYSTLFYLYYIYTNAFKYLKMGYGCALSVVLFGVLFLLTLSFLRIARKWTWYG